MVAWGIWIPQVVGSSPTTLTRINMQEVDLIDINECIDSAIEALVDDDLNKGADQLYELAVHFARGGMEQQSFEHLRGYIVQEAERRTDKQFIREKLKLAERKLYERRHQTEKNRKIIKQNLKVIH